MKNLSVLQPLVSAGIATWLVIVGSPLTEAIRGFNAKRMAKIQIHADRIHWWKDAIPEWVDQYRNADPKLQEIRRSPNMLALLKLAGESQQTNFNKLVLPGEWSTNPTEDEASKQRDNFYELMENLMKKVVELEYEWLLK